MPFERLVKDFMRPIGEYGWINEDQPLKDALQMLAAGADLACAILIVVGKAEGGGQVIKGVLSTGELVFGTMGKFLKGAEKVGPVFWPGQLTASCRHEMERSVADIMLPIKTCVRSDEMLMEAVFLMKKHGTTILPVVEDEDVTGLLHLGDILREIIRIVVSDR